MNFCDCAFFVNEIRGIFEYRCTENKAISHTQRASQALIYTLEGNGNISTNEGDFIFSEDSVLYYPKNFSYKTTHLSKTTKSIVIDFNTQNDICGNFFCMNFSSCSLLKKYFIQLENARKYNGFMYNAHELSVLYSIIDIIANSQKNDIYTHTPVYRIKKSVDYIHKNYTVHGIKISDIAKQSELSERYFYHIFKSAFDMPPKQYITQLRISRAKELLVGNLYSIEEIAQYTGFSDIYSFSKAFKSITGVSPTRLKETLIK